MAENNRQIFILAGRKIEYNNFIRENLLNPNDYPYIYDVQTVKGIDNFDVIRIGSFFQRPRQELDTIDALQLASNSRRENENRTSTWE